MKKGKVDKEKIHSALIFVAGIILVAILSLSLATSATLFLCSLAGIPFKWEHIGGLSAIYCLIWLSTRG